MQGNQYQTAPFPKTLSFFFLFLESCNIHQVSHVHFLYQSSLQLELTVKCFIALHYRNTCKSMVWLKQSIELPN